MEIKGGLISIGVLSGARAWRSISISIDREDIERYI